MKKLFTLSALGLCMTLSAAADKPDNKAFYLVGTMTEWTYPSTESEASGWEYKLTDDDGDGIFTGAFEIPKGPLQFKLFATPGDWDTAEYYGTNVMINLISEPYQLMLSPGYGSSNIDVRNWAGGTFTISAQWGETSDGEPMPIIVMTGSNQPSEILKPDNKAFYLTGSMNNWLLPIEQKEAKWPYRLSDEDGDGVYTGEFDIPAGDLEFKVLSAPGNWDVNGNYGSYGNIFIFTDNASLNLEQNSNAIVVSNWKGGMLKASVEWVTPYGPDYWVPKITLSGTEQPVRPALPDIYMIGDFNDWKLPTAANLNGAILFNEKEVGNTYNEEMLIQEVKANGSLQFGFCQLDQATGKNLFFIPKFKAPFTLYSYEADGQVFQTTPTMPLEGSWTSEAKKDDYTITVSDWKGGHLNLSCYFYYDGSDDTVVVASYDTPIVPAKEEDLYFLVETDGYKRIVPASMYWDQSCFTYVTGKNVSIWLTTEESLDPAPENCWGVDLSIAEAGLDHRNTRGYLPMVKGGAPVVMEFPELGELAVSYLFSTSTVWVSLQYIGGPFVVDKLYVCGNVMTAPDGEYNGFTAPNASNREAYEKYWRLDEVEPGIFSKAYYVPEKDINYDAGIDMLPQFRFFSDLLGWTNEASYGSAQEDFYCLPVDLSESGKEYNVIKHGLGNWGMNLLSDGYKWEASWVRIVVNSNTGRVSFEKVTSGVDEMVAEGEVAESWYNLQGVKVEKPEKGLYIHVRNGKSAVEMVK